MYTHIYTYVHTNLLSVILQAPFFFKALMYTVMKDIFTDKNNQESLFLTPTSPGHDLEWCIVRPGGLGEGMRGVLYIYFIVYLCYILHRLYTLYIV